jgi:[CysO sulfur-carrier protein]-S-L-cysteine hydrolase
MRLEAGQDLWGPDIVRIRAAVVESIVAQACEAAPVEACGYLADCDGTVVAHYPLSNTDASGEHFAMDPAEQFAAVRQMRGAGQMPAAVYHSHPASPARPSAEDIRLAYDPQISYVIISLAGQAPDVKSFRIRDGLVEPEPIEIV